MANNNMSQAYEAEVKKKIARFKSDIVDALHYSGLNAVAHARSSQRPRYTDQTGNLTSSIGYVVTENANIVDHSNFESVINGSEGSGKGSALSKSLAASETSGMSLIVVAGMEYAPYVEAKGYDVLNSAELQAKAEAEKKIKSAIKRLEK